MSIENVKREFEQYGIADRIMQFDQSSATVELAAQALGCNPDQIAKTISLAAPDGAVLIVASGTARIHSGKFKRTFGWKASMLKADDVERLSGHAIGGVCPFANPEGTKVYLDESLCSWQTVYPACGSSNSAIELSIEELERYSKADGWVDVAKQTQ